MQACTFEGGTPPSAEPSPSASPGGVPCALTGGPNLICNGDFAEDYGTLAAQGAWYRNASAPCPGDAGYWGARGYALLQNEANTYFPVGGGPIGDLCTQFAKMSHNVYQRFQAPLGTPGLSLSWRMRVAPPDTISPLAQGGDGGLVNITVNGSNFWPFETTVCTWGSQVDQPLPGRNEALFPLRPEDGWYSCHSTYMGSAAGDVNQDTLTFAGTGGNSAAFSGTIVDDVVLLPVGGPSPSPSPGGGSEGGNPLPAWDCHYNGTAEFECEPPATPTGGTQPAGGSPLSNCTYDNATQTYICDGPAPPSPSPAPSASPSPRPSASPIGPGSPRPSASPLPGPDDGKPCHRAEQLLAARIAQGVPYCWGSRDPDVTLAAQGITQTDLCPTGSGLDCSGTVIWSWREAGVNVPNLTAQGLYDALPHVACTVADLARPAGDGSSNGSCWAVGDLIFLGTGSSSASIYHVAGYAGGGLWTDCYSTGSGCQVWRIDDKAPYQNDFVGAARPSLAWGGGNCGDGGTVAGGATGAGGSGGGGLTPSAASGLLAPFYQKEPMGTILEVGQYVQQMTDLYRNPNTTFVVASGPGGGAVTGPLGPLYPGVSVASVSLAVFEVVDNGADALDSYDMGGVTGLDLIRLFFLMAMVFLLVRVVLSAAQSE